MAIVAHVAFGVVNEDKHEARNPIQIQNSNVSNVGS